MNGRERPRGYPPAGAPSRDRERDRRAPEPRNVLNAMPAPGGMTRAEKFEDEKKRLVQSCFSKRDTDGSINESYITHIRITEDAGYPSGPPPPNSPLENKKPRLIIVSVKKSGRVRMHKSRENSDGTFSIGKTWMLDDLSRIQTYEHMVPSSQSEQQQKMWAANVGFAVTITKPYYWQAATQKERDFFIGSLVKIFKKYTGGKVPELVNFDPRERELIAGSAAANTQPRQTPRNQQQAPRPKSPAQSTPAQPPFTQRSPSREATRDPRKQPSREQFLRTQASQDDMQKNRPRFPSPKTSQDTVPPSVSQPKLKEPTFAEEPSPAIVPQQRTRPAAIAPSPVPPQLPSGISTSQSNEHLAPALRPQPSEDFSRPGSSRSRTAPEPPAIPSPTIIPSRKPVSRDQSPSRPTSQQDFLDRSNGNLGRPTPGSDVDDRFVTPFTSPEPKPNDLRPSSRGSNKSISKLEASITQRLAPTPAPAPEISPKSQEKPPSNTVPPVPIPPPLQPKTETEITSAVSQEPEPEREPKSEPEPVSPSSPTSDAPAKTSMEEAHRPGLGPMVKKKSSKDVASTLRKAANAYGAFKPRVGGAAERLMAAKEKEKTGSDEPDGITGVVPAPLLRGASHETTKPTTPDTSMKDTASTVSTKQEAPPPKVEVTAVPAEPSSEVVQTDLSADMSAPKPTQAERRRQRREDNRAKYCNTLGIDALILDDRGMDFDEIMTDLGWDGKLREEQKIEDLEALVRREIGRVQASSWLGHLELQEGKIEQLGNLFDKTIAECDELDGLLTLYSHELNTLADDVAHIEAQSQGLQVQTANQKLLQSELQTLLKTISISSSDLRALREASLSNPDGVRDTEASLSTLYKAMVTIDSDIRQNKKRLADKSGDRGGIGVYADTDIGQMRAVKDKMGQYRNEADMFLQRLKQYMGLVFKIAEQKLAEFNTNSGTKLLRIDSGVHDSARQELWMYGPLMLFAREVNTAEWAAIVSLYELQFKQPYQNEFRDNAMTWKREGRKPTGDEQELLFTHQEKDREGEGITTAARKLTVRRGKTVRHTGPSRLTPAEHQDGKIEPFEAFAGSLDETTKLISEEQNFIVQFFHLNSFTNVDFPDLIAARAPEDRGRDVRKTLSYDPDREMAKKVEQAMDGLFPSWVLDTQNFAEWTLKADPLQGVGILFSLEKKLSFFEETNQEFILRGLQKIHSRFMGLFNRFVDEQVRGIEETKVKIKKRKGVISFMKVFPHFSASIENMIVIPSDETYDIRFSVNDAYSKINRAMWDSLNFIAKEAPGQQSGPAGGVGDPEDKEALNYHIMIIENMNHYVEEVDNRENIVLMEWQDRATHDMNEHLRLYIDAVIRRPIGKLLDFIESTESLLQTASSPSDIALRPSHSRSAVKKLLASYDVKELRRGIDALKKRVEKHFGEGDDPGLSRSLVVKVLKECEARFSGAHDRMARIIELVYENNMDMEWRKEEATAIFKR